MNDKSIAHPADESRARRALRSFGLGIFAFFFQPATGRPLAALRIGLCLVLLSQAFFLRNMIYDFYAGDGLIQPQVAEALGLVVRPNIQWLVETISPVSIAERTAIDIVCSLYLVSLLFFLFGLFTPVAGVLLWFLHWTIDNTGLSSRYGIDIFSNIFLFYLMLSPCGRYWSADAWLRRQRSVPSRGQRLALRAMQIHLCLSYLATGLLKAQGEQWWNGELLWRALSLPLYQQFDMRWLGQWPWLLTFGGWMTLLFEIGYIVFIWPRRTRWIWILGILSLHLGIVFFLGLHLFGFIMCVLTFALFGVSPEPGELLTLPKPLGNLRRRLPNWEVLQAGRRQEGV